MRPRKDTGVLFPHAPMWDGPFIRPVNCGFSHMTEKNNVLEDHKLSALESIVSWRVVTRGTGICQLGRERWKLPVGHVLCYREPINLKVRGLPDSLPWDYLWINFSGAAAQSILDHVLYKYGRMHPLPLNCETVRVASRFIALVQKNPDRSAFEWSQLSYAFLMTWLSDARRYVTPLRIRADRPPVGQPLNMLPHRVKQFAAAVGYSRAHLSRKLTDHWKQPPGKLLRELRLDHAAKLLRNGNLNITEIAQQSGYSCSQAFGRAFAARFRVTPTAYRHRARGLV